MALPQSKTCVLSLLPPPKKGVCLPILLYSFDVGVLPKLRYTSANIPTTLLKWWTPATNDFCLDFYEFQLEELFPQTSGSEIFSLNIWIFVFLFWWWRSVSSCDLVATTELEGNGKSTSCTLLSPQSFLAWMQCTPPCRAGWNNWTVLQISASLSLFCII